MYILNIDKKISKANKSQRAQTRVHHKFDYDNDNFLPKLDRQ